VAEDSKGKRFVFDQKAGKFVEGKAAPWLPPEQMRGLPQNFTTRDSSDGDKVHEDDPPHIVQALIHEQTKAEQKPKEDLPTAVKVLADSLAPTGEVVPLNQERIDIVRFRIIRARINRLFGDPKPEIALRDLKVDYVFFPRDNVNAYELRAKVKRDGVEKLPWPLPKHLKNFKLEIDIYNWPESVLDGLKAIGHKPPNIQEMIANARRHASITEELQREESLLWSPGGDN
jgi:hypothetical protein